MTDETGLAGTSVHRMLRVLLLLLLLLRQVFASSQSQICLSMRFGLVHFLIFYIHVDETRHDETRRDKTRRDETRRDETRRDEARRDETGRDGTRRDGTG